MKLAYRFLFFTLISIGTLFPTTSICVGQGENQTKSQEQDDSSDETSDEKSEFQENKIPEGVKSYMGRKVAQTMHFAGAEWLIRDNRERQERCSLMLANLGVKRGMNVCDMGCGNGFHTLQIAKMTGEDGLVIGVDVQPEMLGFLRERMEDQGVDNVVPILGSYHNPRLPPETIDLVLMVDVYHEFSHPEQMLASMRKSLRPGGLIVLVEFRKEDPKVPIKPLHKMSKKQIDKEMVANGFKFAKEFDKLPWQHMMFYAKAEPNEKKRESKIEADEKDKAAKRTGQNEQANQDKENLKR